MRSGGKCCKEFQKIQLEVTAISTHDNASDGPSRGTQVCEKQLERMIGILLNENNQIPDIGEMKCEDEQEMLDELTNLKVLDDFLLDDGH